MDKYISYYDSSHLACKILLPIIVLFFGLFSAYSQAPVASQGNVTQSIQLEDFQAVSEPIYSALVATLQQEIVLGRLEPSVFGLLSWKQDTEWGIGTVGIRNDVTNNYSPDGSFLIIARKENSIWLALTQYDSQFEFWLNESPETFIAREAIPLLAREPLQVPRQTQGIPLQLRFPWQDNQEWYLGQLGVHGWNGSNNALDFFPNPGIVADARNIVAAYQGVVILHCDHPENAQNWVVMRHPDLDGLYATEYLHLDRSEGVPGIGSMISEGHVIGRLLNEAPLPNEACGSGTGPHVHFGVGTINSSGTYVRTSIAGTVINGWTVDANSCLTKGGLTVCSDYARANRYFSSSTGAVGGQVYDLSNQPAQGAEVKFSGNELIRRETSTNVNGLYVSPDVPAGLATITAVKDGVSGSVSMNVVANQSQQAPNIILNYCPTLLGATSAFVYPLGRAPSTDCIPSGLDNALFVADVTLPDGTVVSPSQALVKTWRMRNTGSTTWGSGYQLVFIGGEQMGAPSTVNVPVTAPDQETNISINLTAPSTGGDHVGYWRLRNPQGTYFGPTIWVDINVNSGSGYITALTADPPSPANANLVHIYARVENFPNFRAMRLKIDGIVVYEIGAPAINFDWQTSAYTTGEHSIVVEVADQTDTSWSNPEIRGMTYTLTGTGGSNNRAPNRPSPISPYDWYVNIGSPPQLCGQGSDPDGDPLQYQFEAVASVGSYNSGWVNNSCHTFGTVEAGTYEWKVKTRDTNQAESEWSDSWHFSVETSGVTITELYFEPLDPDSEQVRIRTCTSGHAGVGITLNARVNDASDGSDNGQWHIIKELGVPCFNPIDAPVWNTLEYGDGDHRVRIVATAVNPSASDMLDGSYILPHRRPAAPRLAAPIPISQNTSEAIYLNSRTITFFWEPTIRANSYTLHVSTNSSPKDDPNPILRQTLGSGTTQYTHTFTQDHATLYWQVTATNDRGSNHSGAQRFGIDRAMPACNVEPLTPVTYETVFQVGWNGMDALAGIRSFDIQYLDSDHGGWSNWLTAAPVTTTYSLFTGLPGHTYDFRCRATDNSNNTGNYPGNGDTSTVVDPTSRPPTPWWNSAYDHKRNLTILNNMPAVDLPVGYPIHLHFDSTTTPTAAELYAASQSTPKCNDLRIIYNDTTQLNRVIQNCSVSAIDIWFRSQVTIPASSANNASHQMYYGNASPGSPPAGPNQVWYPYDESDTEALYFFQEGSGATTNDSSGHGRHCTIDPTVQWMPSKFGHGLRFNRANAGDSDSLTCGAAVLTNFTVEFWYKPDPDDGGRIAGQLSGGGGNNWLVQNLNGHIRLDVWPCPTCGSSDVQSNFDLRNALYAGKWNHIAVSFNGSNEVKFFINGALDSTKYLPQSGINTFAIPLEIGSAEGISQIKANMGTFRITNGVRISFPYGAYATITNEPATAAGFLIEPPASGNPELAMLSLVTYPNPEGGILVQSVIENQGDRDTENGFFTDLYLDHLPSGPGDYTNSIQYWVNDSIPAGEIVTLTTVLADDAINGLLYAQLDSTGVINEVNEDNNIFSDGLPICVVTPDDYETDDIWTSSTSLLLHTSQTHNIHRAGDEDWFAIQATVGQSYTIKTVNLGVHADTYLYVYGANGTTLIVSNDDYGGSLASHVEWTAPTTGTYYVMVRHWNPNASGCDMQYTILFGNARLYLPLVIRP